MHQKVIPGSCCSQSVPEVRCIFVSKFLIFTADQTIRNKNESLTNQKRFHMSVLKAKLQ
jgi:hypothetical protein